MRRVEIRPQSEIGCGFANFGANPAVAFGSAVNEDAGKYMAGNDIGIGGAQAGLQSEIGYGLANLRASPAVAFGSAVNELAVNEAVANAHAGVFKDDSWLPFDSILLWFLVAS